MTVQADDLQVDSANLCGRPVGCGVRSSGRLLRHERFRLSLHLHGDIGCIVVPSSSSSRSSWLWWNLYWRHRTRRSILCIFGRLLHWQRLRHDQIRLWCMNLLLRAGPHARIHRCVCGIGRIEDTLLERMRHMLSIVSTVVRLRRRIVHM